MDKLCSNPEVSNRTNQQQTQVVIELQPVVRTDRAGQPFVGTNPRIASSGRKSFQSQEIKIRSVHEEAVKHDRMGQPVVNRDESAHEQTMLNEVNMAFRIPGLPHSVVKHAESSRVREMIQKIENDPDRHALQIDLQQHKAYNQFSATSKTMIQNVGNIELFELLETDSKTQCKACVSYWSEGIVYCTCGHLLKQWPIEVS